MKTLQEQLSGHCPSFIWSYDQEYWYLYSALYACRDIWKNAISLKVKWKT